MEREHPNAIAYRRTADAFRSGDRASLERLIAADAVWHVPGEHHMAGVIRGRESLLTLLDQLNRLGSGSPRTTCSRVMTTYAQ